ncbi:phosphorylase family protein, partial [Microbispora sp. ATCC PTA-5024]|uniref:phosphorylase family protein n=1 Tax=Microbispora sp. ATCC PTA-5024 TaxID=316330 RepID=UPI0003DBDD45
MTGLVVCVALALESRAIRRGLDGGPRRVRGPRRSPLVVRVGMGPVRAARAAAALPPFGALAVAGLGGALDDGLRPGDVLVATEVRWDGAVLPCPYGPALAAASRAWG